MVGMRQDNRRENRDSVRKIRKKISADFLSGVFQYTLQHPDPGPQNQQHHRHPDALQGFGHHGTVKAFCRKAEIKSSTRKEGSTMPRVAVNAPFIPACLSPV